MQHTSDDPPICTVALCVEYNDETHITRVAMLATQLLSPVGISPKISKRNGLFLLVQFQATSVDAERVRASVVGLSDDKIVSVNLLRVG